MPERVTDEDLKVWAELSDLDAERSAMNGVCTKRICTELLALRRLHRPADPIDEYTGVVPPKHGREFYEGGVEALNELRDLWAKSDMTWKQAWETMMEHVQGHLAVLPPDPDDEPQPYPSTRPSGTITAKFNYAGRAVPLPVEEESDPRDEALRLAEEALIAGDEQDPDWHPDHCRIWDQDKRCSCGAIKVREIIDTALASIKAVRG